MSAGAHFARAAAFSGILSLLVTRVAAACPACAAREDGSGGSGVALFFVYAAMVAAPFVATALVFRIVRRLPDAQPTPQITQLNQREAL